MAQGRASFVGHSLDPGLAAAEKDMTQPGGGIAHASNTCTPPARCGETVYTPGLGERCRSREFDGRDATGRGLERPRTTHLDDDVAPFLQDWLDEHSDNARQSLAGRAGVHVVALVASLDCPAAGMIHTMMEPPGEAPTAMLRLPAEIDVLIAVVNADVLRFTTGGGWSRRSIPPHL